LSFCLSRPLHFYNPSLAVEGQEAPGHATFKSDKQKQKGGGQGLDLHGVWSRFRCSGPGSESGVFP